MAKRYRIISGMSDRIDDVIYDSGMSQNEIARKMGVERKALTCWKNEEWSPSAFALMRFCYVTGVSSDYILGLTNNRRLENADKRKSR